VCKEEFQSKVRFKDLVSLPEIVIRKRRKERKEEN